MRKFLILLTSLLILLPATAQFRPLYLSGKVTLPDGSTPPEPVLIRLYCADGRKPQAYTDRHGAFNFAVGGSQQTRIMDASQSERATPLGASGGDRSFVSLTGCELMASLAGYTSSKIDLGRRSVFENPDIGVIVIRPVGKDEGQMESEKTREAPDKAAKALAKAQKELEKPDGDPAKAAKELEKAVETYQEFSAAWNLLGEARLRMKDLPGARTALQKAVAVEPKFVAPYLTLIRLDFSENKVDEALKTTEQVLKLSPELPEAHYHRALALTALNRPEEAEASLKIVDASGEAQRFPRTHFMLGNLLMSRGDIGGAAAQFREYLKEEPKSRAAEAVRMQLQKWEADGSLK